MKPIKQITLMTVATMYAGYVIRQAVRTRAERVWRLAAGESAYERTYPRPHRRIIP
jgi:hypothetical protein